MSNPALPEQALQMLREIVGFWANRNVAQAVRNAGGLTFWRDGMLHQLEAIASGKYTEETVKRLRSGFDDSKDQVEEVLDRLKGIRSKIGPNSIGKQIDLIVNHAEYGKTGIRGDIELLLNQLEHPSDQPELTAEVARGDARHLVESIQAFNAEIGRLQRLAGWD